MLVYCYQRILICCTPFSDSPRGEAVISAPHGAVIVAGQPLQLHCEPPSDPGHPEIGWYEWRRQLDDLVRVNTTLPIWQMETDSVTQSDNYSCVAGNSIGASATSSWLQVLVEGISLHVMQATFSALLLTLFFGLFPIWGRCIKFSNSTFSGIVLLLSLVVSPSCLFL